MGSIELRYLSRDDILKLNISMEDAISVVEQTYYAHASDSVHLPAKIGIHPKYSASFFHAMPAMVEDSNRTIESAGLKWVSYFPGNNAEKNLPDASCVMLLNDVETGLPYCFMEGLHLTYLRTAASGAIAAKKFAPPNPKVLGIVGAGAIARWSVKSITAVLPSIKEIRVTSRTKDSRELFCEELSELYKDITFTPYSDLETLVNESDITLSITSNTGQPFIHFDWVKEGALALSLDGIKSWDASFNNADHIISDDKNFLKSEIKRRNFNIDSNKEVYDISELMENEKFKWSDRDKNIAIMSGIGSTDVTIAKHIYNLAVKENIGTVLPF